MNISYNWLKRYLKTDLSAEEMATILTDIGLEVESFEKIESIRGGLAGVVVGEVLTCTDHPDSDHLHLTTVASSLHALATSIPLPGSPGSSSRCTSA